MLRFLPIPGSPSSTATGSWYAASAGADVQHAGVLTGVSKTDAALEDRVGVRAAKTCGQEKAAFSMQPRSSRQACPSSGTAADTTAAVLSRERLRGDR